MAVAVLELCGIRGCLVVIFAAACVCVCNERYSLSRILRTLLCSTAINLLGARPQLVRRWPKRPLTISEKKSTLSNFIPWEQFPGYVVMGTALSLLLLLLLLLFISYKPLWTKFISTASFFPSVLPPSLHSFLFPFSPYLHSSFYVFLSDFLSPCPHWFWDSLSLL